MAMLWHHRFNVDPIIPGVPSISNVAEQTAEDTSYYFEGRKRPQSEWYCFEYTLSGEGMYADASGEYRITPGSGFLWRVNDPETIYGYPPDATVPWHFFYLTLRDGNHLAQRLLDRFGPVFHLRRDSAIVRSLLAYRDHPEAEQSVTPGEGLSLACSLLAALADAAAERTADSAAAYLVSEIRRSVAGALERNLNVSDIAAVLKVTPEHLCRVFKQETGMTPLTYISREKMRYACELLQDPAQSCKEVSSTLGFDNASHFARSFRRVTGMTPSEYRRKGGSAAPV